MTQRLSHSQHRPWTTRLIGTIKAGCIAATALAAGTLPASAQNLFAPAAHVNDSVVTNFELEQRIALFDTLGGGTGPEAALDALINERLQREVAARFNIVPSDEAISAGIAEFAARGDLAPEQFLTLLSQNGVSAESFRDFVAAGLAWRTYARAKFASRVSVSEADIDRALRQSGPSGGLLVSMSEIFLPARDDDERAKSEELAKQIAAAPNFAAFAAAAKQYSVAPSRDNGGRMESVPIGNLPAPLRTAASSLKPGEVSDPLFTGNAIGIFQLRGLSEIDTPTPAAKSIEYAAYYIAGGRSEKALEKAAKLRAQVDTCNDLYGAAKKQPPEVLEINTLPVAEIPTDVAKELAQLDPGEMSTALTRSNGETLVVLMLCDRVYEQSADADRDAIRTQIQSSRIGSLAASHLAELRADATIVIK